MILPLLVAAAWPQDPDDAAPPAPPPAAEAGGERAFESAERIDVYGDLEVERARREVIETLRDEGYTTEIRRDGYLLLRHEAGWKGEVRLYDDGWMIVKRQPVRFTPPDLGFAESGSVLSWMTCALPIVCLRAGGQLVSQRKFWAVETRTAGAVNHEITTLADEIAYKAVDGAVDRLPERLEALWDAGAPLAGDGPALATYAERRRELFAYWDSRTDTPWGDQVRAAVEAFIRGVVQTSEHPYTDAEVTALNAERTSSRVFSTARPASEDDLP